MDSLSTDLRYGVRMLLRTPGLTLVAILTIALGVGLTTHAFSVVYGSVMRGLAFDRGTTLVALAEENVEQGDRGNSIPILDLVDWREQQSAFRGLGAFTQGTVNLADEGSPPERYDGAFVSASLFEQVDGAPILGRVFRDEEDARLGPQVVVISHDVWQNRYGGDPDIVGRAIRANAEPATIVGVMPEGFHFPFNENVWLPLDVDPSEALRGQNRVQVVARLLEGVSLEQADVQMDAIAARIAGAYPETNEGVSVWVQSYEDAVMPPAIVNVMWVMLVAVFGVLLIACFNVANLLLARATVRAKEVAVRSALGADRGRIVRQLLLEAGLIAAVGGIAGAGLAYVGVELFNASILEIEKPYWIDVRLDPPALFFTMAITGFAGLAAGTIPAIRASGGKVHEILQDESRGSSSLRIGRFSSALVIGEIALSCALLVGAGMMIKSVANLKTLDMGFERDRVFTARVGLFETDYPDDDSRRRFYARLVEDLEAEPEVEVAALTTNLPAIGTGRLRVGLEGVAYPDLGDQPFAHFARITPGYFEALGVAVTDGRDFSDADRAGAVDVALVNESFATRHYGARSPLDERFRVGQSGPWMTIVGVLPDLFIGGGGPGTGTGSELADQFFTPLDQAEGTRFVSLVARTRGEPGAFGATAQQVVSRIDPALPLYWLRTMDESIETGTWAYGMFGSLFGTFGAVALFLAAVGLYGVMAFSVGRRTQEMGVRLAMGATTRNVFALVLGKGMRQLGIGAVVGLALGALMARPMAVVFFDVEPSDPTVYAAIVLTLGLAGLLACVVPARRATRVELVEALRPR